MKSYFPDFKMDLSIIIVNFNTKKLILECIKSIEQSDTLANYEIIVVDNASTDCSIDVLDKLKNIKFIKNNDNLGYSKANNVGIKNASGKYILLLNSDTVILKGSLDKLLDFAQSKKDAGVIAARLLNDDGTIQKSVSNFPTIWRTIKEYWLGEKDTSGLFAPKTDSPVKVDWVVGAAFLITPEALKKVGLLNEKYFMYFEDMDYCRKIKKTGLKVYYLPEAKIIHHLGASGAKITDSANQWRRLIPSSKIYHGMFIHYLINFILWTGQKFKNLIPILILVILIFPTYSKLLQPGFFSMQDDLQAFRVYEMDKCFDDFQIPCRWVPDAGYQYGYPQFNFYPPLPYYLGAGLHRIGFQFIVSVKILFVLGYILSAVTMFILIRSLLGTWPGLIASLLYTYIPYKAVEVYVRGALSEFWAQIFFPLILWAIYKLIRTGKIKYIVWFAVTTAALATTHALMTMIFVPVAIIWSVYWLYREKWNNLLKIVWGGLLGFGLSAFFILPVIFEKRFTHVESMLSGYFDYRAHFVSLYKLFLSMEWGYGSSGFPNEKLNLTLGIVQWVVAFIIAPVIAVLNFKKHNKTSLLMIVLVFLSLASVFMIHMKSSFIWAELPFLWYMQFPWRFLAISIFLLCILAGYVIFYAGRFKYILGIILVAVSFALTISFYVPKNWLSIKDTDKFSGVSWEKQLTISIFDYLPIYATLPPVQKAPPVPEVLEGNVKFLEYKKGSDFQEGLIEATKDSLIRIPLFDFPGMKVKIDGKVTSHVNNDCRGEKYCLGLITFSVPVGSHTIDIRLYDTPVRKIGNILTLISLGGIIVLMIKFKRK
jgi:GT2 family glycosyltransferase